MEWEFIKSDREIAEEFFEFKDSDSLKKKMMEYDISDKDADLLLEKLALALEDFE